MIKANVLTKDLAGFDAQLEEVRAAVNTNLKETAQVVRDKAKANLAPRRLTGNLEDSIAMRVSRFEDGGYIVSASGSNKEDGKKKGYHAANVEFGHVLIAWGHITHRRVPPHPFLRPAVNVGYKHAVDLFRSSK